MFAIHYNGDIIKKNLRKIKVAKQYDKNKDSSQKLSLRKIKIHIFPRHESSNIKR